MALCRIVEALFAFRTRGIQEQVLVSQHSQYGFLWTLRYLRTLTFLSKLQKYFKLSIRLQISLTIAPPPPHTCSVIQPRCLTSMPGCMLLISSFTRGKRLAAPAWMALYQDWAMAGSFALRNTEFFLLDEITSKYLANEMTEKENDARRKT